MLSLDQRPHSRAEAAALFGDPGHGEDPDPAWRRANIVELHGGTAIPGLERWYFQTHRLIEPLMREAFARAFFAAPGYITRAASFVFRRVRHDAAALLSYHAWGIAVDINAADNAGRWIATPPATWTRCTSNGWAEMNFGDARLPGRFWSKVHPEPMSGCWLWTAGLCSAGYGATNFNHKQIRAHRLTYEVLSGDRAVGLDLGEPPHRARSIGVASRSACRRPTSCSRRTSATSASACSGATR
jgi:hypothetical protein